MSLGCGSGGTRRRAAAGRCGAGAVEGRATAGWVGLGQVDGRGGFTRFPAPVPYSVSPGEVVRWRTGDLPPGALAGRAGTVIPEGVSLRGLDRSAAFPSHVIARGCVVEDCLLRSGGGPGD